MAKAKFCSNPKGKPYNYVPSPLSKKIARRKTKASAYFLSDYSEGNFFFGCRPVNNNKQDIQFIVYLERSYNKSFEAK